MRFFWTASVVSLVIAIFLTTPALADSDLIVDTISDLYKPVKFDNIIRTDGCASGRYHALCKPGRINPASYAGCEITMFLLDSPVPANQETCLYHNSGLDVTTCFRFGYQTDPGDVNYLLYRILWDDLFGFFDIGGMGMANYAWAQGYVYSNPDSNGLNHGTHYGVFVRQGRWSTLESTLPDTSVVQMTQNVPMRVKLDTNCQK